MKRLVMTLTAPALIVLAPCAAFAQATSPVPAVTTPVVLNGCSIVSNLVRVPDSGATYSDNTFTIQYTVMSAKDVKSVDATGSAGKGVDRAFNDGQPFPKRGSVTHTFKFDGIIPITSVSCKINKVNFADGTSFTTGE